MTLTQRHSMLLFLTQLSDKACFNDSITHNIIFRYNNQLKSLSGMSIDSQMAEVARIEMLLAEEENKRSKWKQENIRRRHNYLPLIMEMLRSLASRGELLPIYNKAKEKSMELDKMKKEKKAAAKV